MTKKKARGLGNNPLAETALDAIIPAATPPSSPPPATKRQRFSTYITEAAAETLRDIAWWNRVPVAALVESAIRREIEAQEAARGQPFPRRGGNLNPGHPIR